MKRVLSLAAVVGIALVTVVALAIADDGDTSAVGGDAAVARVAPDLAGLIAAFAREQTPADRLPAETVDWLTERSDVQPGEAPELARRIELSGGAGGAHLWPKTDGLCWSLTSGGGGCFPTFLLAKQGVVIANGYQPAESGSGTLYEIFALARTGIAGISLSLANGETVDVPLRDNAAHVVTRIEPVTARWENLDGTAGSQPVSRAR